MDMLVPILKGCNMLIRGDSGLTETATSLPLKSAMAPSPFDNAM